MSTFWLDIKNCATVDLLVKLLSIFSDVSGSSVSRISHSIDTQLLLPVQLFLIWAPSWAKWKETQNYHSSIKTEQPAAQSHLFNRWSVFQFVTKAAGLTLNPSSGEFSVCTALLTLWIQSRPLRSKHCQLLIPSALKKSHYCVGVCMQCHVRRMIMIKPCECTSSMFIQQ